MHIFPIQMGLFSLYSKRLLISGLTLNDENRYVCKCRDLYFRDSTLLILQQDIVGFKFSNFKSQTNQTAYYKMSLECVLGKV